jgi:hypothetical protein
LGCASPPTALSPMAAPFFPTSTVHGRPKELRWANADDDSPSYRDILLRQPKVVATAASPVAAQGCVSARMPTLRSVVVVPPPRGEGGHRKRPRRRGCQLPPPPPWTDRCS